MIKIPTYTMDTLEIELILQDLGLSRYKKDVLSRDTNRIENGRLVSLDLSGLAISNIPKGLFTGFEFLRYLDLSDNRIGSLPRDLFHSQIRLEHLDLSKNRLTSIPVESFKRLVNLRVLDLSNNRIGNFPDFTKLEKLEVLNLFENPIHNLTEGAFSNLSELKTLNIRQCELVQLPELIFSDLSNLRILNLGVNNLKVLGKNIFMTLKNLEELYLDMNKLSDIPDLTNSPNLQRLWLQGNELEYVALKNSFRGLEKLTHLFLNENRIEFIERNLFGDLISLQFLLLNGNRIKRLEGETLESLNNLEELWLMDNPIDEAGLYRGSEQVSKVIERLKGSAFLRDQVMSVLRPLSIEEMVEDVIKREGTKFRRQKLVAIDLSGLGIEDIERDVFAESPYIEELNLSDNRISVLKAGSLDHLPGLRVIDLSRNQMTRIQRGVFHHRELKVVDLSANNLPKGWNRRFDDEFDLSEFLDFLDANIKAYETLTTLVQEFNLPDNILDSHYTQVLRGEIISLDLSEAGLTEVPSMVEEMTSLKQLRLNSNQLKEIKISLPNLELLDVRRNDVKEVEIQLPSLKFLYLSDNPLTKLPNLRNSTELLQLDAENLQLEELDDEVFTHNTKLLELNLRNTGIKSLPQSILSKQEALEHLDLSENQIRSLPQDLFNSTKRLLYLNLSGNPLGELSILLQGNKEILQFIQELVTKT